MNYTDKTAVQNYTLTNINSSFDTQLAEWIAAMSRFMDKYTGRTLVAADAPETRKYDGTGTDTLIIDDVHTITAVTVDEAEVTPAQYPANSSRKYRLVLPRDLWITGLQNVEVTGHFGYYDAIDDGMDIKFACTVLVAGIVNAANRQDDGVKSEKIGEYAVVYKNDEERADYKRAMQILDNHRKMGF